jgi:Carboxypeptidase regulatory-like domain
MHIRVMARAVLFCLLACVCLAPQAMAQTQTGTVEGKAVDQQGAVLPGVNVTLSGPRGSQSTVTDASGLFRFVGVAPATYTLKAELTGFLPQEQTDVIVAMGKTVTADFALKVGGVTETVEVTAASTLDVKSSATHTNISQDMLTLTPMYSSTSINLLNYAPGINSSSAYGAQGGVANALLLDGVDTRDPEGGSAWTFFNQNLIEEIQIGGLGAPAEYGGFTGAIINTVTKSGGNAYSGLFSMRYTNDSLASNNLSDEVLKTNPSLGEAVVTKKLTDYTVQMGGPLKRDKAFFFGSIQRYSAHTDPVGLVANRTEISPRVNLKFTLQPSSSDTIVLGTQYDAYNVTGRVGYWPAAQATDNQTVEEDAPEWVWNAQWRKVMGSSTFLEAKFTGYTGYYNLDPVDPSPFTYDADLDQYSGGGGGLYYADRTRNQVQVALTRYADAFGHHSLKFGAEIERSHVRSQYQPYGPAGFYVLAYSGIPYYRVSYSYDFQGDNRRTSLYAQDSWTAGKLTVNLGLRMDHIRGYSPELKETVYTPHAAWGPRIGAAYDLTGKGTAVLKGFYGRYFEGTASSFYTQATPGLQDLTHTPLNASGAVIGPPEVEIPGVVYGIGDDIRHPRTDEVNVAWENQLGRSLRFTATGIWRKTDDFINNVINGAQWQPVTLNNALKNTTFTGYRWANSSTTNDDFVIRNVEGYDYVGTNGSVIATADPHRSYKAMMLLLNSSMKRRLGFQVSYVLAKAEGNVSNSGGGAYLGNTTWNSPNTAIINAVGELINSRRHEVKVDLTYNVPKVDVFVGALYFGYSGTPYTPFGQYSNGQLNLPTSTRRQIFLEPRGTERNDFYHDVDLRAEKAFRLQEHRFGVYADIINLFNTATVTSRQARYPSTTIGGNTVAYQAPTAVQGARQVTFGGRWSF